eukprot:TRINITY_DN39366_c0_g1_i1.p1 TRINITY_DN39366_c0_g1~~TRINITY_DN39366_c0_g1_i1.p1  ORF type:complete len:395 (+),score=90.12 TRINITY_DN39366_c0_g1_i1:130-1314(+)
MGFGTAGYQCRLAALVCVFQLQLTRGADPRAHVSQALRIASGVVAMAAGAAVDATAESYAKVALAVDSRGDVGSQEQEKAPSFDAAKACYDSKDVAFVNGGFKANGTFWEERCRVISDPEVSMVMITMGPAFNSSWCDMFTSNNAHLWSSDQMGGLWEQPKYYNDDSDDQHFGGSAKADLLPGRSRLFFWGSNLFAGGCCGSTAQDSAGRVGGSRPPLDASSSAAWGQPFAVSACRRCGLLVTLSGAELAGPDFWLTADGGDGMCDGIPQTATMIRVSIGSVVDYYKPRSGSSLCEMLQRNDRHFWSSDGKTWRKPGYSNDEDHLGGSAEDWPLENVPGDGRKYLSFWGSRTKLGGCCSSSLGGDCTSEEGRDGSTGMIHCFNQAVRIEYCLDF